MRRGIVVCRDAELVQHRSGSNVGIVECGSRTTGDRNIHAPPVALHDERSAVEPEPVGEPGQQRIDRRKDTPVRDVGTRIHAQWAAVDEDRDGSSGWE